MLDCSSAVSSVDIEQRLVMVSMILIKGSPMLILDNTHFRKVCETLSNAIECSNKECSNKRILASSIIFLTYPSQLLIVFVLSK